MVWYGMVGGATHGMADMSNRVPLFFIAPTCFHPRGARS